MITLVHAPRSRSSNFLWLLEEFGEPYSVQYVSIRRGDGSGTIDPSNPHPRAQPLARSRGGPRCRRLDERPPVVAALCNHNLNVKGPGLGPSWRRRRVSFVHGSSPRRPVIPRSVIPSSVIASVEPGSS